MSVSMWINRPTSTLYACLPQLTLMRLVTAHLTFTWSDIEIIMSCLWELTYVILITQLVYISVTTGADRS